MVSTFTPNKNIERPGHNDYPNTWDVPVNADWTLIDTAFGGTLLLNATALSGTQALTVTQTQPPTIQISGAPTAAITYTVPSGVGGVWVVRNTTTGGKAVSIQSAASLAGVDVVQIPAGQQLVVWCDGTNNGMKVANSVYDNDGVHFPDGTVQTTAAANMSLFTTLSTTGTNILDFGAGIPALNNGLIVNNIYMEIDLIPSTSGSRIFVQYYNSLGVLDTTAVYDWVLNQFNTTGSSPLGGSANTGIVLSGSLGNARAFSAQLWINNIQGVINYVSASKNTQCNWTGSYLPTDNVTYTGVTGAGTRTTNGPITGVRLNVDIGTFGGQASLYIGP